MFVCILRFMRPVQKKKRSKDSGYRVGGRIWIKGPEGAFLGYGRVVLLEHIRDHGSISAAARSMSMSYRHAWKLVDSMNAQAKAPLVQMSTGGSGGGGAVLTDAGERAIAAFWQVHDDCNAFFEHQTAALEW